MRRALYSMLMVAAAAVVVGECVTKPEPTSSPSPVTPPGVNDGGSGVGATNGVASPTGGATAAGLSANGAPGGGVFPSSMRARTAEKRRAELDKRLSESVGSFDAQLRKEQEKTAQERDARQGTVAASIVSNASSYHGSAKSGTGQAASASASEVAQKSTGRHGREGGRHNDARASDAGGMTSDRSAAVDAAGNPNGALAKVVVEGSGDDVVARRLRRAAEIETDPELKGKLWKEYVEYKKNTQGQ